MNKIFKLHTFCLLCVLLYTLPSCTKNKEDEKENSKTSEVQALNDKKNFHRQKYVHFGNLTLNYRQKKALLKLSREKRKNLTSLESSTFFRRTTTKNNNDFLNNFESESKTISNEVPKEVEFFGDTLANNKNYQSSNNDFLKTNPYEQNDKNNLVENEVLESSWWKEPAKKDNVPSEDNNLESEQFAQNWWEGAPPSDNQVLTPLLTNEAYASNEEQQNVVTTSANWWEEPTSQTKEDLPWWLENRETKEYNKIVLLADNEAATYDTTLFDLYLGDQQVGLVLVNYTDKWFSIPEPGDMLEQLTGVKNPSKLYPLIEGRISNSKQVEGVGEIALDRDAFKLLLSVPKDNLTQTQLAINKIIENPQNKFTVENRVLFMTSGNIDDNESTNSFSHKTLASYGKRFLLAQGNVNDEDEYELQELNLGTIVDKYSVKGGYLQNRGNNFTPSLNIIGMKIETEEQLFLDSDLTIGSKIEIFVPSTAKVLFYKNDLLIDYQILNYGLQEIDTTRFPQGSYNVDVEIKEYNGRVTKERHFFTKSGMLAARERPVYYASAGTGRDGTDMIEVPVVEAGLRMRATDFMETEGSIFATESISIASSKIRGLWKDYFFDLGASVSNEADVGYNASLTTTFRDTFFNISWTEVPGDSDFSYDFDENNKKDKFLYAASNIKNKRRTINGNIQRTYKNINYGVQGSYTTNTSRKQRHHDYYDDDFFLVTDDSYAVGPFVNIKLMQDANQSLDLRANYYFKKQDDNISAQLLYNRKLDEKMYNNTSLNFSKETYKYGMLRNSIQYNGLNSNTNTGIDLALDTELSKYEDNNNTPLNNNLRLSYGNPYFFGTGNINNLLYNSNSRTNYGGSFQSSMILTEDGFGRIMTPQRSNSMVIINIKDNTQTNSNSIFSVIINDMKYSEVKANTPSLIALSPYKTYKVRIATTEESDLTEYDNKSKLITLFPGNIGELIWEVKKVFVAIGTIVDSEGNPIKHQRIRGTSNDYVYTEGDGSFQANLTGQEKLYIKSSKYDCKIELPEYKEDDIVVDFNNVVCK